MIITQTNEGWNIKKVHFQEMAFTPSLSVNGYDSRPLFDFFADRINVNAGWLALKKSPFVCCFTSYTPDSLTRFPSSKDTFAKRPQFWCMLAKERIWPRKPAELGKRTRSRNFCTLSNLFKTLYDSHLPSISAFQLHGTIALCQFYLSFTVLCWSPLLF